MGVYDDQLASLQARLVTDTGERLEAAKRRIPDVEAAIKAEAEAAAALAEDDEVETAAVDAPENASRPGPKSKPKK